MAAVWDVDHFIVCLGLLHSIRAGVVMLKYLAGAHSEKFRFDVVSENHPSLLRKYMVAC